MKFDNFKKDKGVAGLTILLSLVTMLFIMGLLIMIFSLMGGELKDADSVSAGESATITQSAVATVTGTPTTLTDCSTKPAGVLTAITSAGNDTGFGSTETITISGNFTTYSNCTFIAVAGSPYDNETLSNVTYTITYGGSSYTVINDTVAGIGSTTDWFDIFIVIGAMVVLILLTVIIITAIRGSGLMTGGGTSKSGGTSGSA